MNKFSIIVPTLNSYKILKNLVNSIKSQTWHEWEVVFVDGGSSEKHINYLKDYAIKIKVFFYKQLNLIRDLWSYESVRLLIEIAGLF